MDLVYRRKTKQQPAELFKRKTEEAKNLPEYGEVARSLNVIREGISDNLSELEKTFADTVGHITVCSEKNGSPAEKKVSVSALDARFIVSNNFIFQISGLWRRTTAGLAIQILWTTKQRSGVAVNMLLKEWEARQHHDCSEPLSLKVSLPLKFFQRPQTNAPVVEIKPFFYTRPVAYSAPSATTTSSSTDDESPKVAVIESSFDKDGPQVTVIDSSFDKDGPQVTVIESSFDKDEPPVKGKIDEAIASPVFEPLIVDGNDALLVSVSSPGRELL